MGALFQGLYINLDRRTDRRAHIEGELAQFKLREKYRRLRAFDGPTPAIGCYRSHQKALEEARSIGGLVHILEDDSILSSQLAPFLETRAAALLEEYDILFLDMWIDQNPQTVALYQEALDAGRTAIPLHKGGPRIAATSSYLVAPHRVGRLHRLLRRESTTGLPIDGAYDKLVKAGEVTAAVVVPFLTGVDLDAGTTSDIQPMPRHHQRMFVMLRTRFFSDRTRQDSL